MGDPVGDFRKFLELSKSPETVKTYMSTVREFMDFLRRRGKSLDDVELRDCVDFLYGFENRRYAARNAYALKAFLKYVGKVGLAEKVPVPKYTTRLKEVLTKEEIERGLEIMEELVDRSRYRDTALRNLAIIALAYEAGLRIGEVVRLNKEDFRPEKKEIVIHRLKTKGGEPEDHVVPLSDYVVDVLQEYLRVRGEDGCEALFACGEPPHRCSKEMIRQIFKKFARIIGKEHITFHTLRRSRGTHLYLEGKDPMTIAKLLHHKNPASTAVYVLPTSEDLRRKLQSK